MNVPRKWSVRAWAGILAVPLAAGALAGPGGAAAAATTEPCDSLVAGQPPSPGALGNQLNGVTVLSPCNAWAVGGADTGDGNGKKPLIEHWDGATWTVTSNPAQDTPGSLLAVDAASPASIWAVGSLISGEPVILHWNGTAWKKQLPSTPIAVGDLNAVHATSGNDAWAVGDSAGQGLILHWNGTQWRKVKSPSPPPGSALFGVTATSRTSAWAVGQIAPEGAVTRLPPALGRARRTPASTQPATLIERWDGTKWTRVASPSPAAAGLNAISAISARDAWAVGFTFTGTEELALALHWNGRSWTRASTRSPGGESFDTLVGVAATSASNAWAVGVSERPAGAQTLILRFNGSAWSAVTSPNPGTVNSRLLGVAATSAGNAWAVGSFDNAGPGQALAFHCC